MSDYAFKVNYKIIALESYGRLFFAWIIFNIRLYLHIKIIIVFG